MSNADGSMLLNSAPQTWLKAHTKLIDIYTYKRHASCEIQSANSTLFWTEKWQNMIVAQQMLELHSVSASNNITAKQGTQPENMEEHFHRTISVQAFEQFDDLRQRINSIQLTRTA
jgi:hypothetical protein